MHWTEDKPSHGAAVSHRFQDLSFRIRAATLPLDHASALSEAVIEQLPWLTDEPGTGIHPIHYPSSGSGWTRQEDAPGEVFFVSNRARLKLRLPIPRLPDASSLSGRVLDLDGHRLTVGKPSALPLRMSATLFARRVIFDATETEEVFVDRIAEALDKAGITARKILCGQDRRLYRNAETIPSGVSCSPTWGPKTPSHCRKWDWGPGGLYGCGLFIPHKGIVSTAMV